MVDEKYLLLIALVVHPPNNLHLFIYLFTLEFTCCCCFSMCLCVCVHLSVCLYVYANVWMMTVCLKKLLKTQNNHRTGVNQHVSDPPVQTEQVPVGKNNVQASSACLNHHTTKSHNTTHNEAASSASPWTANNMQIRWNESKNVHFIVV